MIEKSLLTHLQSCQEFDTHLTKYADSMAIFFQEAPADTDDAWAIGSQYGRIVFFIDIQDDPEREFSGTLSIDFSCLKNEDLPEEVEPIIRSMVDGYFFVNENVTMLASWATSQYFTEPTEDVIGVTLTFTLMNFPNQETTSPDPISLINSWSAEDLPQIVGVDQFEVIRPGTLTTAWKPSNENPAIFWRLGNTQQCTWIPDTFTCSWLTATLWGHIFASDRATELKIARLIQNTLLTKRRLIFEDMSPLMVDRDIRITNSNDPLRAGQLSVDGTYGVLHIPEHGQRLNNISIT